jgi:outer membrane protein TolC
LRRSILSGVRTSYIRAQLAQQETRVVLESFELAKSQSSEIAQRFRAGSASRLDSLNAQREVATYELKFSQSRAEEEAAGIDLLSLTGEKDPAVPPQGLKLDSLQVSGERLEIKTLATFSPEQHPLAVAQNALAQSAEHAATSQLRSYWPNVQFQARTSLDYPNGPVREQFHQNTLQVNLSMPVWDWGYTGDQVAQKRAEAQSALAKRENALVELRREYQKILARLESLKSQKTTALQIVKQSESVARLVYQAYRAGRSSLVDVQAANLRALEAKLQLARVEASSLVQFTNLRSLVSEGD